MMYPELKPRLKLQGEEEKTTTARFPALYPAMAAVVRTDEEKQEAMDQGRSRMDREMAMVMSPKQVPAAGPALYPKIQILRGTEEGATRESAATVAECASAMAPVVVDLLSWQRGKDVLACNRHMLDNQLACDVWFRVGAQKEGAGGGERVGAHTYVLLSRSSEFYVMLTTQSGREGAEGGSGGGGGGGGDGGRQRDEAEIDLPHTSPRVFWQLLRYLYYEHLQPEEDTVLELLTLAETYDVPAVRDACLRFLEKCLAVDTACSILETAHRRDDRQLTSACLTFLREHGQEVVRSSGVGDLCRECLNKVLTLEGLVLTSSERQEAADRWVSLQCQNRLLETTSENKQKTLGEVLYVKKDVKQSQRFFSEDTAHPERSVKARKELSSKSGQRGNNNTRELDNISLASFSSTTSKSSTATPASVGSRTSRKLEVPRAPSSSSSSSLGSGLHQVTRFRQLSHASLVPNNGTADAVSFSADHDILLYGFGIYGNTPAAAVATCSSLSSCQAQSVTYRVDTAVSKKKKDLVLESIVVTGAGLILPVMLERPVRLKREKTYTLAVYLHGPPSLSGSEGRSAVRGEKEEGVGDGGDGDVGGGGRRGGSGRGVTFFFSQVSPPIKGNVTGVRTGQIPRLYYLPC